MLPNYTICMLGEFVRTKHGLCKRDRNSATCRTCGTLNEASFEQEHGTAWNSIATGAIKRGGLRFFSHLCLHSSFQQAREKKRERVSAWGGKKKRMKREELWCKRKEEQASNGMFFGLEPKSWSFC